jgi:hypothetical protein
MDRKKAIKRVRNMSRQDFLESRAAGQAERERQRKASARTSDHARLMDRDCCGLSAKQPLADVPGLFIGVRVFRNLVDCLFPFPKPKLDSDFLIFSSNPHLHQVSRFLFPHPALQPTRHFPAIPIDDAVPITQSGLGRGRIGLENPTLACGAPRFATPNLQVQESADKAPNPSPPHIS